MDLGLVCPEATGHLNPSLTLGQELARRGHRVRIVTTPAAADKIAKAGLEHVVIGKRESDEGLTAKALSRLGTLSGIRGLLFTSRLIVEASLIIRRELPALLKDDPCDALLIDQVCPGAATVAEDLNLPYIILCNALAVIANDETPPPTFAWRYSDRPLARLRNRLAITCAPPLIDLLTNSRRGSSSIALCFGTDPSRAILTQQPPGFDFPTANGPGHLHYTGPWHLPTRDNMIAFPWERLDGRPLIYASLGTVQNRTPHLFRVIINAVRGLDAQVVLSFGRAEATWNEPLPENVIAVPYAPQPRLLVRATLAITHAGLNTALECLAAGVPMLCLPITNDQPGVASRVEWVGAGRMLMPRRATPARVRELIEEVLTNPRYRQVAQEFQMEIANTPGPSRAADLIEQALNSSI